MSDGSERRVTGNDYMTRVATTDTGRTYKKLALTEVDLRPGARVLDLGSGPGADLLAWARPSAPRVT